MIEQRLIHSRSLRSRLLGVVLRWRLKPKLTSETFDPVRFRAWLERNSVARKTCPGVDIRQTTEGQPKGEWHLPATATPDQCLFYLHGGGYTTGSIQFARLAMADNANEAVAFSGISAVPGSGGALMALLGSALVGGRRRTRRPSLA